MMMLKNPELLEGVEWTKSVRRAVRRGAKSKYEFHKLNAPNQIGCIEMKKYGFRDFKRFAIRIEQNARQHAKKYNKRFAFYSVPDEGKIYIRLAA